MTTAVDNIFGIGAVPLIGRRCDPYGAESGGPKRLLGGLHGPNSARIDTDEMAGLPEAVVQGEHTCPNLAQVTVRMVCAHGHKGAEMELCSWHDEEYYHGEYVAGKIRRVKDVRRVHGHFEEIQRRQAGACPRCLFPGQYPEWYKALFARQQELALLMETGRWYTKEAEYQRQKIEDIVAEFDRGNASGEIHKCPMRLEPIS
jgi:hypothetical protein